MTMTDKAALRREALARRAALTQAERDDFAARLAALGPQLVAAETPVEAPTVSVYSAIRDEVDPAPLLEALAAAGIVTALPVIRGRGLPLQFRRWRPGDAARHGQWGIVEPAETCPEVAPDLLFVPLAAFDARGHRIGYGAGYYDQSLAALRRLKPVRAIGLAFSVQEVASCPAKPHDEPLDAVVTEAGLRRFSQD